MAISYGFFNSVDDDRLYNAETFNNYFEGLISQSGVFKGVGGEFAVTAATGLHVNVADGKALVNTHWIKSTAVETLEIETAHNLFDRYDLVCLTWSESGRDVTMNVVKGTASTAPIPPMPRRSGGLYDIVLAVVLVEANATTITTANIFDQRPNTANCGFITGIIEQVDITELFAQYEARFAALENSMRSWETASQDQFDTWFYNLTQNLTVGAYIMKYNKVVNGGASVSSTIALDMIDYTYDPNDVIICTLNGLMLQENLDYTIDGLSDPAYITVNAPLIAGNRFEVIVLKSNMAQTTGGMLTVAHGTRFIHIGDAMPGEARKFTIGTLGETNTVAVANKNLFRIDQINEGTYNGVILDIATDGTIDVDGTGTDENEISVSIDKNAFVVGEKYTLSGGISADLIVRLTLTCIDDDTYEYNSVSMPSTFTVPKQIKTAVATIYTANGATFDHVELKPQLEYGSHQTEFLCNSYSTFTYDGVTVPVLTGVINNIWVNDDAAHDLSLIYVVLGTEIDGDDIQYPI